jgi:AcrR family transcriptional regulator
MSQAKQDLVDRLLPFVAEHGMSDLSLRELAEGVGSSHRMLLYHFGSRAGVVAAIAAAVEQRQREVMHLTAADVRRPAEMIEAMWQQVSDPQLRPFIPLFFEVLASSLYRRAGTEAFLRQLIDPWVEGGEKLADSRGWTATPSELRLGVAVVRGLLIDLAATGDLAGTTDALRRYAQLWEATTP